MNKTKKNKEKALRKFSFFLDIKYEIIAGSPNWPSVKPKDSPPKNALLKIILKIIGPIIKVK